MRFSLISLFAWLCMLGSLWSQTASATAEGYKYPKAAPVLSVIPPLDWTVTEQAGPAQLLLCSPPNDSTCTISVMTLPSVGSKEDLKDILTRIVRAGATGAGMTNVQITQGVEGPIGGGPRVFTKVTASGKHNGEDSAFTYDAFTLPGTGRYYAVGVAGLQVMIDAHKSEFESVAGSIAAVK